MATLLQNITDIKAATTGLGTASIGLTISLSGIQSVMGIAAAFFGICLTVATGYWRYQEHKRRMEKPKGKNDPDDWDT